MSATRALILLVNGVDEIDFIIYRSSFTVLRSLRLYLSASPICFVVPVYSTLAHVTMAGLFGVCEINCAQKARILPDISADEAVKESYDVIIVPGGLEDSMNFKKAPKVGEILRSQLNSGGSSLQSARALLFAMLFALGFQKEATLTSHPLARGLIEEAVYKYSEDRVVVDEKMITSRGPGTMFEFARKIIEILVSAKAEEKLKEFTLI